MRLWTLHPEYLDPKGLVALWREALLGKKVLQGKTAGYRRHPQLNRFRKQEKPSALIAIYLEEIYRESVRRGYSFDRSKIEPSETTGKIHETEGQLLYEWRLLKEKLRLRNRKYHERMNGITLPEAHPLFVIIPGPVAEWEMKRP